MYQAENKANLPKALWLVLHMNKQNLTRKIKMLEDVIPTAASLAIRKGHILQI